MKIKIRGVLPHNTSTLSKDVNYIVRKIFSGFSDNVKIKKVMISKNMKKKGEYNIEITVSSSSNDKISSASIVKNLNKFIVNSNKGDKYEGVPLRFEGAKFLT